MTARIRRSTVNGLVCFAIVFITAVAANGQSKAANGKISVTVAEAIRMVRLGGEEYFSGGSSSGRVAHFSPDGKCFVILLRKGNLETNTNEYSLLLFQTASVFHGPKPEVLLTLSSSSNQDAIRDIKWMTDNDTISFLGGQESEASQVYSFNIRTKNLKKLTSHPTPVSAYDLAPEGGEVLYLADPPSKRLVNSDQARREGIIINNKFLIDILGGDCAPSWWATGEQLFLQKPQQRPRLIPVEDYLYPEFNFMSVSPGGRYALVRSWVRGDVPKSWTDYQSSFVHENVAEKRRNDMNLMRFLMLDTKDGSVAPLLNTPMEWYNDCAAWSADGQSIYLTTRLPLDAADPAENEERKRKLYDVEVRLPSKEIRKIRTTDFETVHAQDIEKKIGGGNANTRMEVMLEEDINTPPKIYVSDTRTHEKALLLDLNPQFTSLEIGKAETVEWKAGDVELIGGLYFPPDYAPGKRYPLVIQTHGFSADRFAMDGRNEWSSGFAARPLAGNGFVVLQVEKFKNRQDHDGIDHGTDKRFGVTPAQSRRNLALAAYEGAIDYLDGRGIIDRNRVGISGFSRTVAFVAYTLTHTKYPFGAAVMTDGITGGYFETLAFPSDALEANALNGGASPFGKGIETWLKESPTFNLDKVKTPVRLVAFGPSSTLGMWEWFSGLSLQNKPVDFIEIPDGAHLLQKPWERRIAMQGMVDWFRFWLKGEEDPDPLKADQYARWHQFRKVQQENEAKAKAEAVN